jgi:DNA-directed RNA polymerase specialized sigma24 family protein
MNLAADRARSLRRQTWALLRLGPPPQLPSVSVETLALVEALRTLPVRQRQAIVLHYLVDLPVQEIPQTLEVPSGTARCPAQRRSCGGVAADGPGLSGRPRWLWWRRWLAWSASAG